MATFNADAPSQGNGYSQFLPVVGGAVAGAGAYAGAQTVQMAASDARIGKWLSLGIVGFQIFSGNSALTSANAAMTQANAMSASGALAAADTPLIRGALQNLATAIANLTPGGYTGISAVTNPSTSPSVATTQSVTNNGALVLAALAVAYLVSRS